MNQSSSLLVAHHRYHRNLYVYVADVGFCAPLSTSKYTMVECITVMWAIQLNCVKSFTNWYQQWIKFDPFCSHLACDQSKDSDTKREHKGSNFIYININSMIYVRFQMYWYHRTFHNWCYKKKGPTRKSFMVQIGFVKAHNYSFKHS